MRGTREAVDFTFLIDPLCGWCYGAMPCINKLRAEIGDAKLVVMPTGLFAGNGARPMTSQFRSYAWANDQRIAEMTDQTFSQAYYDNVLSNETAAFDSGPASLVLALADQLSPGSGFDLLLALQQARFVAGRDLTDQRVLIEVAVSAGLAAAALASAFQDAQQMEAAVDRITAGRRHLSRHGLEGVPTLLWQAGDESGTVPNPLLFGDGDALIAHCQALLATNRA
ncbi:MAG TPA: DsbA family protein [Dongiaceae bacterium]|nr:DsbA family protein [Dongiaceae bacterium]